MYSSGSDIIDTSADQFEVTQDDVDKVLEPIDNIDITMSYDTSIMNIITEESSAFFAGQKSAERYRQNYPRQSTYLCPASRAKKQSRQQLNQQISFLLKVFNGLEQEKPYLLFKQ